MCLEGPGAADAAGGFSSWSLQGPCDVLMVKTKLISNPAGIIRNRVGWHVFIALILNYDV